MRHNLYLNSAYTGSFDKWPFTIDGSGNRGYGTGLDIMALLGSDEALDILIDRGDTDYDKYQLRFSELKDKFDALDLSDWNFNLYWSWLYSLKGLLCELPEGYPQFMRTQAWRRSRLNAALASWTQLRHDTILYNKAHAAPPPAGRIHLPPGYIEPNPVFWGRLLSLTRMTSNGLKDFNVLTPEAQERLAQLEEFIQDILVIVRKQLTNQELSSEDEHFFSTLPARLESIVTVEPDQCSNTAIVADVMTNSYDGMVVEEAVGKVDLMIAACPTSDGRAFLAAGPVLSYYEFKHPMNDRLTDEAWRSMLDSPDRPDRPQWYIPLILLTDKPSEIPGSTRLTSNYAHDVDPCWSPDGLKIAFVSFRDGNSEIYVMNSDGSEPKNLTNNPASDSSPCWSSDGQKIVFSSGRDGLSDIYIMNTDGSQQTRLTDIPGSAGELSWSPDGQKIAYTSLVDMRGDIFVINFDESERVNLTNNPASDGSPSWSPDGRQIAFDSNRDGNTEIYIMNADGSEQKRLTNTNDFILDSCPCWSPDGLKIAYASYEWNGDFHICTINTDGGEQRTLISESVSVGSPCWSPDGQKIAFHLYKDGDFEIYVMDIE